LVFNALSGTERERSGYPIVAIAGAAIEDLWKTTAGRTNSGSDVYRDADLVSLRAILEEMETNSQPAEQLLALYFNLNTRFLLNPAGEPDLEDCTPIELVGARDPEILLVSIGSNEGLFRGCMMAKYGRETRERLARIPLLMENLADELKTALHDGAGTRIVFTSLVKPRTVANLAPSNADTLGGQDNYFGEYVGWLIHRLNRLSRSQVKAFDTQILEINAQSRQKVLDVFADAPQHKVFFVDLYGMSECPSENMLSHWNRL
jgi:hypothetical protein